MEGTERDRRKRPAIPRSTHIACMQKPSNKVFEEWHTNKINKSQNRGARTNKLSPFTETSWSYNLGWILPQAKGEYAGAIVGYRTTFTQCQRTKEKSPSMTESQHIQVLTDTLGLSYTILLHSQLSAFALKCSFALKKSLRQAADMPPKLLHTLHFQCICCKVGQSLA